MSIEITDVPPTVLSVPFASYIQRTGMICIIAGFGISAIALHFKKKYLFYFGIIMQILSFTMYVYIWSTLYKQDLETLAPIILIMNISYPVFGIITLLLEYIKGGK